MSTDISHEEMLQLNEAISEVLEQITIAIENYPELKSSEHFLQLQAALNEIEEQISAARRAYNTAVTDFNNSVLMFPTNIVALIMGFEPAKVFKISHHERESRNWYNS